MVQIKLKMMLGREKDKLSRFQLPLISQTPQTFRDSSFLFKGPWINLWMVPQLVLVAPKVYGCSIVDQPTSA